VLAPKEWSGNGLSPHLQSNPSHQPHNRFQAAFIFQRQPENTIAHPSAASAQTSPPAAVGRALMPDKYGTQMEKRRASTPDLRGCLDAV